MNKWQLGVVALLVFLFTACIRQREASDSEREFEWLRSRIDSIEINAITDTFPDMHFHQLDTTHEN